MNSDIHQASPAAAANEAPSGALLQRLNDTWARGDANDDAAAFTEDGDLSPSTARTSGVALPSQKAISRSSRDC